MEQKNYYEILGVAESATQDDIKKAYRDLAKKYHPDKNAGDAEAERKFKEVGEAYDILGDTGKRRKYDQLRKYGAGGFRGNMNYDDFARQYGQEFGANQTNWGFTGNIDIGDIFSELFGGFTGHSQGRPHGGGNPFGQQFRWSTSGTQQTRHTSAKQQSEPQPTEDPFFKRKGNDAYVDMPVNIMQALLGSKVRVRTPNGKRVQVAIPAGMQPGATLKVTGMGYEGGDLYIRTKLAIPNDLTDEQREHAEALGKALDLKW